MQSFQLFAAQRGIDGLDVYDERALIGIRGHARQARPTWRGQGQSHGPPMSGGPFGRLPPPSERTQPAERHDAEQESAGFGDGVDVVGIEQVELRVVRARHQRGHGRVVTSVPLPKILVS